jgi:hypothetical protein
MVTVNIHQAKTQLSQLLALVARGEEVIVARAGPGCQGSCRMTLLAARRFWTPMRGTGGGSPRAS